MWFGTSALPPDDRAGIDRLRGNYSGQMDYRGDMSPRRFQVEVALSIAPARTDHEMNWTWKFNYRPPEYTLSRDVSQILNDGTQWQEARIDDYLFKLRNWSDFCAGKCDWFEIEREVKSITGNQTLRRRYEVSKQGLNSERWLRPEGGDWFLSHRMTLRRLP
jgi:hypothetical protein